MEQRIVFNGKQQVSTESFQPDSVSHDEVGVKSPYSLISTGTENIVDGLKAVAPYLEEAGVTLVLEPLNEIDHPGYFLNSSKEAFRIIDEVGSPYVKVLFDIYHQQITEGNLSLNIRNHILNLIHQLGDQGYVGMEYVPTNNPSQSLMDFSKRFSHLANH